MFDENDAKERALFYDKTVALFLHEARQPYHHQSFALHDDTTVIRRNP